MSALQTGLLVAGLLVLVGVLVHGWWTARRRQPRQADPDWQQALRTAPAAQAHRVSSSLSPFPPFDDEPDLPLAAASQAARDESAWPEPERRQQSSHLDSLIDVLASIELELPVSGEAILHNLPTTRRVGGKPYAVEARTDEDVWEPPQPGSQYRSLQTGVQLANRSGSLNELEYSEFVIKTQALADALGGSADLPDMLDAVARARELDAFAQSHDAQLSVTLRAHRTAWSAGYVQQLAARQGFVTGVLPGRMVLPLPVAHAAAMTTIATTHAMLTLQYDPQAATSADPAMTAIREVVLSLDVPQVPHAEHPYERLRSIATTLAEQMDGRLTDDAGRLLSVEDLDRIGSELESLYDALDAHGLSAGSPSARRLFA